jgi:restriction system protein
MTIPDFQSFFYPFLKMSSDKTEHSLQDVREYMTDFFSLTDEDKTEMVPSGTQSKFDNRIYWAKSYLIKAKLLEATKRAHFRITEMGIKYLEKHQENINVKTLKEIEEFREFHTGSKESNEQVDNDQTNEDKTPLETLEDAYLFIQKQLAHDLLEKVKSNTWQFFEDLVIELMVKMGYGGSKNLARKQIQRTNDEGIDGVINEDKLGLDVIYLQAKRWTKNNSIGRPEIQKFVGALHGKRAKKGVFITTGSFAKNSYEYVRTIDPKVILIDGETLSNLMIEYGLGTTTIEAYQIKKIDLDYFEE